VSKNDDFDQAVYYRVLFCISAPNLVRRHFWSRVPIYDAVV